jgi:hypothetical protein
MGGKVQAPAGYADHVHFRDPDFCEALRRQACASNRGLRKHRARSAADAGAGDGPGGPALKNEMMLPAVLDPWAAHALYEAAHLARQEPRQQGLAGEPGPQGQAAAGDDDGGAEGPPSSWWRSTGPSAASPTRTRDGGGAGRGDRRDPRPRPRGCCCSAAGNRPRAAPASTLQMVGERLGIVDQFQGVDQITVRDDGSFEVLERVEGGKHQVSVCAGRPPCWAGPPAICPSRATIRRSAWPTCAASCPRCSGQGGHRWPTGCATLGEPAQAAARDAHRKEHAGGRDRARNRRLDRGGVTMESILLLAHTEADGSLARSRLWRRWRRRSELGGELTHGLVGGALLPPPIRFGQRRRQRGAHSGGDGRSFQRSRAMPPTPPPRRRSAARPGAASCWRPPPRAGRARFPGVAYRLGGRIDTHATGAGERGTASRR